MAKKYFTNESLATLIDEIKSFVNNSILNYYTKTQIDNMEFITVNDIDTICGTIIQDAREVTF